MKVFFAFGFLILIAFLGSRFLFRGKKFLTPTNYFILSGLIYVFLGIVLGKHGLSVLSPEVLKGLHPLISLGLGWIGFLFGFQLEFRYLRRFPRKFIGLSFLQSFFVFALVSLSFAWILSVLFSSQPSYLLYGMAVAFGLLVSLSSPTLLNFATSMLPRKGDYYYLARFLVSVSGFWAVSGLILISSFWRYPFSEQKIFLEGVILFSSLLLFALLIGSVFHLLTKKRAREQDVFVFLLSLVFFSSGAAFFFNLPPLCVCMVMGITFSNLTRIQEKIYPLLLSAEKPFYIIFLILIGALWELDFEYTIAILVGLIVILRVIGFSLPLKPVGGLLDFPYPLPFRFGLCFLSPGGIAVAFAISIKLMYPLPLTDIFFSAALLSIIISEFVSPWALKISLLRLESEE